MTEKEPSPEDEVLLPDGSESDSVSGVDVNVLALIKNYTNRPDLLIAEIEKHDPGFVSRMNASALAHSEKQREDKLTFAKVQAYTALGLQVVAGLLLLGSISYAVISEHGGLLQTSIGLALFYGVAQSGSAGFSKVVSSFGKIMERFKKNSGPSP